MVDGVEFHRLLPSGAPLTAAGAAAALGDGTPLPADRPLVALNMVSTADGRAAVAGTTVGLGGPADRELFHALRTRVDAVMVGARTAILERYGRAVRGEEDRRRRREAGLSEEPLTCLLSARMSVTGELRVLRQEGAPVVVVTASGGELGPVAASVSYLRAPGEAGAGVDLSGALARLRAGHGVRSVLCEGGPSLNRALLENGLVDELFLTLVPVMTSDDREPTIVGGPGLPDAARMELVRVLEHEGHLFLRYRLPAR